MKNFKEYLLPIVCVIISVLLLVIVINPSLAKLKIVQAQLVELRQSEERVNELMSIYDELRSTYQQISEQDKQVLEKALPSNINNVRLILELERIAELRGLGFKDVDVVLKTETNNSETTGPQQLRKVQAKITLIGDYPAFVEYVGDLEKSLRILTMRSVDFRALRVEKKPTQFEYDLVLETYWFIYPEVASQPDSSTGNS